MKRFQMLPTVVLLSASSMMMATAGKAENIEDRMKTLEQLEQAPMLANRLAELPAQDISSQHRRRETDPWAQKDRYCGAPCYEFGNATACDLCCEAQRSLVGQSFKCEKENRAIAAFERFQAPNRRFKICPMYHHETHCLHVGFDENEVSVYPPPPSHINNWRGTQWSILETGTASHPADNIAAYKIRANPELHDPGYLHAGSDGSGRFEPDALSVETEFFDGVDSEWILQRWPVPSPDNIFRIASASTPAMYLSIGEEDRRDLRLRTFDDLAAAGWYWDAALWQITEIPEAEW